MPYLNSVKLISYLFIIIVNLYIIVVCSLRSEFAKLNIKKSGFKMRRIKGTQIKEEMCLMMKNKQKKSEVKQGTRQACNKKQKEVSYKRIFTANSLEVTELL